MTKIAASVICRDELARYLPLNIQHLLEFCDQIFVLDDGSTDGTSEYLAGLGIDRIQVMRLGDERATGSDFLNHAQKRNELLQFSLTAAPTYILAIDADEFVDDGQALRSACERQGAGCLSLTMRESWGVDENGLRIREDHLWRSHEVAMCWHTDVLPRVDAIVDNGPATGRTPKALNEVRSAPSGATVFHLGWANPSERQGRYDRYMEHDAGKHHQRRHLESIMWQERQMRFASALWPEGLMNVRDGILQQANTDRQAG